jgi:signal transduction histidine kinase
MSHDLRGPLSIISGHAQILLRELQQAGLSDREQSSAQTILRATRRISTMLDDLVDAARLESGRLTLRLKPVRLHSFVEERLQQLNAAAPPGELRIDIADELPPVLVDPDRLARVVLNLLARAASVSEPGATLSLTACRGLRGLRLELATHDLAIPAEELPHLFEQTQQKADSSCAEGLGRDLYIARLLIEAHGGTMGVRGEPSTAVFFFELPLA